MTSKGYEIESVHKVYDNSNGCFIEIRIDPDHPELLKLQTTNKESKEYYGNIDLVMTFEQAKKLAKAIELQLESMGKLKDINEVLSST